MAVETILKYSYQINQFRDISNQYHTYKALKIMRKQFKLSFAFRTSRVIRCGYVETLRKIKWYKREGKRSTVLCHL